MSLFFTCDGDHRDLHVRTHSFPTRRSSDLPQLSDAALRRVDQFMKTGGMILFDTRDQANGFSGTAASPNTEKLRQLLAKLDIPPLMPVPNDHEIGRAHV